MTEAQFIVLLALIGAAVLVALWLGLSWIDPPDDEPTEHGDGEP